MSTILQKQDLDVAAVRPALTHIMNKIALAQKGKTNYQSELAEKITKIKDKHGNTTEVKYKGHKLSLIENAKKTAKEVEETRGQFCENLTRNINNRFPKESTDVATCFHVLGMRGLMLMSSQEQAVFGNDEIGILVDHYGKDIHQNTVVSKKLIDGPQCRDEWETAKQLVVQQKYPTNSTQALWKLIHQYHADSLPNLMVLAQLALIMPYQTADCERGFSAQNLVKTARRSTISEHNLNVALTIKYEGGHIENFDFSRAINIWKFKKNRRYNKK